MEGKILEKVCEILEKNYKGVYAYPGALALNKDLDYLTIDLRGLDNMKLRNMPFAAKRILAKFPQVRMVHFTGDWQEHVYSRETLKWLAI